MLETVLQAKHGRDRAARQSPDLLLAPGQRKWLESIIKQPVGGQVIEQFFGALDGKVDLRSPWKHPAPHERGAG